MQRARPPLRLVVFLVVGNLAFIASWVVVLWKPAGWLWLSLALLLVFLVLRVGGMWWQVRRYPDEEGRMRRSAILTTILAVAAVALWAVNIAATSRPRVERHIIREPQP
ncbi:hypothetical protein P2318_02115 [Myxococcaceae bacterium GXIMD 01537]